MFYKVQTDSYTLQNAETAVDTLKIFILYFKNNENLVKLKRNTQALNTEPSGCGDNARNSPPSHFYDGFIGSANRRNIQEKYIFFSFSD
jgi:hypothetical protein